MPGGDCSPPPSSSSSSSSSCVLDTRFPEYFGSDKLSWALRIAEGLGSRVKNRAKKRNKMDAPQLEEIVLGGGRCVSLSVVRLEVQVVRVQVFGCDL